MGSDPGFAKEGFDDGNNDNCFNHVPIPIPTEDISLDMSFATNAKSIWIHFWYRLVGNRSQFDRILCCLSCKFFFYELAVVL